MPNQLPSRGWLGSGALTAGLIACASAPTLAAAGSRPGVTIFQEFKRSDMEVRHVHRAIRPWERDEQATLHQRDREWITDIVMVATRQPNPKGLERLAFQELAEIVGSHDLRIAFVPALDKLTRE